MANVHPNARSRAGIEARAAARPLPGPGLDAEWQRIAHLVGLAEASRSGSALSEDFSTSFDAVSEAVVDGRRDGVWRKLADIVPESAIPSLTSIDIDLLALAMAPDARPLLAARLHSLQPQSGGPYPSLALIQELLMLDTDDEIDCLYERLAPAAPLAAFDLVRIAGEGAYQTVRASPVAVRTILGRPVDLAPPPGAHLVTARAGFDDLVLPEKAIASLRDLVSWIRHHETSARNWGLRTMHGPLALFSGPSGTGKTFAASVVADALSEETGEPWALYALDLGRIMSKYVGETEENLNRLLDALHGRRAILQIDEADGLLGKRGEVSDARDRYANLEVSHMLSRFERHNGPVILTTNLRANIDAAFLRRFQLVIDFPAPDLEARTALWERSLPTTIPGADRIAKLQLAEAVRLSGGSILNAATYATVLAAGNSGELEAGHIARAVWAELSKNNRQVRRSEIGFLADYVEAEE